MDRLDPLRSAIHAASDPLVLMRRVVEQAVALIPASDGAVVELAHAGELTYVCAAGTLERHTGLRLPIDTSLSGLAVRTGQTLYCEDSHTDPRVDRHACERIGERSFVCIPLQHRSEAIGVLKVSATQPGAFAADDLALLTRLADFVSAAITAMSDLSLAAGALLGSAEPRAGPNGEHGISEFVANVLHPGIAGEFAIRSRVERALRETRLHMVCQPIVEIDSGRVLGVEALARFAGPPEQPPDAWFAEAQQVGLGVPLELTAVRRALALLPELPASAFLAINVGPGALASPELSGILSDSQPERVVLELTEHLRIDDYPYVRETLDNVRACGARLAIDDTGAGFASLGHILNLAPELIKLDRQFSRGIDTDPARRAVAQSLVSLAQETDAQLIAEGIETTGELATIRRLGIPYGQGYYISGPRQAASVPEYFPHLPRAIRAG